MTSRRSVWLADYIAWRMLVPRCHGNRWGDVRETQMTRRVLRSRDVASAAMYASFTSVWKTNTRPRRNTISALDQVNGSDSKSGCKRVIFVWKSSGSRRQQRRAADSPRSRRHQAAAASHIHTDSSQSYLQWRRRLRKLQWMSYYNLNQNSFPCNECDYSIPGYNFFC